MAFAALNRLIKMALHDYREGKKKTPRRCSLPIRKCSLGCGGSGSSIAEMDGHTAMRHVWWAIVEGGRPAGRLRPRDPTPKQGDSNDFFSVGFVMGCQRAIRAIPGSAGGMLLGSTAGKVAELGNAETRDEMR
ncbi:hypothetical protein E4U54_005697 [Claviceps lovelessii]|nr:hypothetical protein E4U54_005697 [Claviceps lovelessii]